MASIAKNTAHAPINARSDIVSRILSFLIITPLFLMTGYRWLVEGIINEQITMSDLGWVAINCSALVVLILGSVLMRGHNNRRVLFVEAFMPVVFWFLYMNLGSVLVANGLHYVAAVLGPVLYALAICYLVFRVNIENKVLFIYGGRIAPAVCAILHTIQFHHRAERVKGAMQSYAINAVKSKGKTNFQFFMLSLYVINFTLWTLFALTYVVSAVFVFDIPFHYVAESPELRVSHMITEYWGFNAGDFFTANLYDFFNTIWALGMIYYIFTDYFSPDEVGSFRKGVKNYTGHGAKPLIL